MKTIAFIVCPFVRPIVAHAEMVQLLTDFQKGRVTMNDVIWRLEHWSEYNAERAVAWAKGKR